MAKQPAGDQGTFIKSGERRTVVAEVTPKLQAPALVLFSGILILSGKDHLLRRWATTELNLRQPFLSVFFQADSPPSSPSTAKICGVSSKSSSGRIVYSPPLALPLLMDSSTSPWLRSFSGIFTWPSLSPSVSFKLPTANEFPYPALGSGKFKINLFSFPASSNNSSLPAPANNPSFSSVCCNHLQ